MSKRTRAKSFSRRKPSRKPYDKILVVCEGQQTEPNYFNGLKNYLRLNGANVAIVGEGAAPTTIVERAKALDKWWKGMGDPFDKIFCVFDKDTHADYQTAIDQCAQKNYVAVTSVPAFEYWLLLHFRYTTKPYDDVSGVLHALKEWMPNYHKSYAGIFAELRDKLETAKKNAARSLEDRTQARTDNPSTKVHILVQSQRWLGKFEQGG
ncbi:MAG: RloB family protein [Nitrospira sp.]|nr:RloB family protein [Nitrospira sp.]